MEVLVAPFAGAWIEMLSLSPSASKIQVAPFAGAWIEIWRYLMDLISALSLPSRERG